MKRSKLNFIVDLIIGIAFMMTTISIENYYLHIITGIIFAFGVLIHIDLHKKWIVIQVKKMLKSNPSKDTKHRNKTGFVNFNVLTDSFIGIMFILSTLSGIVLIFIDSPSWLSLHKPSSFLLVLGAFVHVVLHWRWIFKKTKTAFRGVLNLKKRYNPSPELIVR